MTGRILMAAAALAAAAPLFVATAQAADPSQPDVVPDTGQINPGHAPAPWSTAAPLPQDAQPAQEDARAALMMPDNGAPSAGQSPGQSPGQNSTGQAANPAANPGQSGSGDFTGSA